MPSYGTQPTQSLFPGQQIALVNNAATDTEVTKTIAAAIGSVAPGSCELLTLVNSTNVAATVMVAAIDGDYKNYWPLTNGNTSPTTATPIVANAGSSVIFSCIGPFVSCQFAGDSPTQGSLILCR